MLLAVITDNVLPLAKWVLKNCFLLSNHTKNDNLYENFSKILIKLEKIDLTEMVKTRNSSEL